MQLPKNEHAVSKVNSYYSRMKAISKKSYFVTFLILSIIIVIWGTIYASIRVKSEFEKEAMVGTETADTHYGKAKEVLVVNEQFLQKAIIGSVAELSSIASLSDLTDMISEQTLDKIVCIKSFQNPVMDDNLEELFIKSEGSLGEYFMAAWDLEYYELSSNLRDLYGFASNVKPRTDYSANGHDFLFMVGKASGVSITGGAFLDFEGDFYPAIDQKYLTRIGVKLSPEDIKILEEDKKALDEIKKSETAIYEEMKISHKELMKAQRASIRKMFCARWFGVMFNVLISFLMLRLLTAYYSILRRKDMRKKTTHDVYFATNTSSAVLRWIALIGVIIGIIGLFLGVLLSIIRKSYFLVSFEAYFSIGFLLTRLALPLAITAATILSTWIIVLFAEYVCFVSNLYHIVFVKVYGEIE